MKLKIHLLNSLWLIIPLLIWNIILGPYLTIEAVLSDANSPQWLLIAESSIRLAVFALPLFIPIRWDKKRTRIGFLIFILGTLIYFGSWIPLLVSPQSAWSSSTAGLLAPRLTPLLPFIGIAVIGRSWTYAGLSGLFILLHTIHGIQNLN